MCGLVGIVTKAVNGFNSNEQNSFAELLYVDALRGEDSTGVCGIFNDGSAVVHKDQYEAYWFLQEKAYEEMRKQLWNKGRAAFGHNRKKTVGKVSSATAHPFVIGDDFVFMHNGTLTNHKDLADTEVDSEALGMHIKKAVRDGGKAALEEAMGKVRGAYACVWYDQQDETLNLMRNSQRPLWLATCSSGFAFCSEPLMLAAILNRNNVKYTDISQLEEETLYTIALDGGYNDLAVKKEKLEVKKAMPPITNIMDITKSVVEGHQQTKAHGLANGKRTSSTANNRCTKNAFKKLSKQYLGKRIEFWFDDYVERAYPIVDGNYLVWGQPANEDFPSNTIVQTVLADVSTEDIDNLMRRFGSGVVYSTSYDKKSGTMIMYVDNVKSRFGELNCARIEETSKTEEAQSSSDEPGSPTVH